MNTERLIDLLSANLEPVGRVQLGRMLLVVMLTGGAAAFTLMLATVGPRANLDSTIHLAWTAVKLFFAISVITTAAPLLLKSMRPGLEKETRPALLLLPFFAALAAALVMLFLVTPHAWGLMLRGAASVSPARCLLCIVFFAAAPFAALVWALRQGAPIRLRLAARSPGSSRADLAPPRTRLPARAIRSPSLLSAMAQRSRFAASSEHNSDLGSSDGDCRTSDIVSVFGM